MAIDKFIFTLFLFIPLFIQSSEITTYYPTIPKEYAYDNPATIFKQFSDLFPELRLKILEINNFTPKVYEKYSLSAINQRRELIKKVRLINKEYSLIPPINKLSDVLDHLCLQKRLYSTEEVLFYFDNKRNDLSLIRSTAKDYKLDGVHKIYPEENNNNYENIRAARRILQRSKSYIKEKNRTLLLNMSVAAYADLIIKEENNVLIDLLKQITDNNFYLKYYSLPIIALNQIFLIKEYAHFFLLLFILQKFYSFY